MHNVKCKSGNARLRYVQSDLNLLTALDALLEEGSVGGAAQRLHLSAPAMSRTLGRIRQVTGDQILVRTGRTMTPTPYALRVRERVHEVVDEAQGLLQPERELDLASLSRTFTIQAHDAITLAIGPLLLSAMRDQAPFVSLRLLPEGVMDTLDLRHGTVDLELGSAVPENPEVRHETLSADRLVVAMRRDHPLSRRNLTVRRYAEADHISVSRRGRLRDRVDDVLESKGLTRRVRASAPTTTAALYFVQQSHLITIAPERMCRPTMQALGLLTVSLPLELPASPVNLSWHERYENDRAHRWLRGLVSDAVARALG